jgi:DNA-3-methyladenine glycosylase
MKRRRLERPGVLFRGNGSRRRAGTGLPSYSGESSQNTQIAMTSPPLTLTRDFYARNPADVARELLGKILVRDSEQGLVSGRIVETEAYLSSRDAACHAHRGPNRKNATMFGPAGHAYVYMIHARWCLNTVTEGEGLGSAVLIRAIEPLEGIELMQDRRGVTILRDLARGPARLCQALGVTKTHDGWDLTLGHELWIADDLTTNGRPLRVARSRRIGINSAQRRLLRYFLAGSPYVSGKRATSPARKRATDDE